MCCLLFKCMPIFVLDFERELKEFRESLDFGQIPVKVNGAATFMIFEAVTLILGIICFIIGLVKSRQNFINISAHFLSWAGNLLFKV